MTPRQRQRYEAIITTMIGTANLSLLVHHLGEVSMLLVGPVGSLKVKSVFTFPFAVQDPDLAWALVTTLW
jgi:hypothetical protein